MINNRFAELRLQVIVYFYNANNVIVYMVYA